MIFLVSQKSQQQMSTFRIASRCNKMQIHSACHLSQRDKRKMNTFPGNIVHSSQINFQWPTHGQHLWQYMMAMSSCRCRSRHIPWLDDWDNGTPIINYLLTRWAHNADDLYLRPCLLLALVATYMYTPNTHPKINMHCVRQWAPPCLLGKKSLCPHLSSKTSDEKTALPPPIKQNQRSENRFAPTYQAKPEMRKPLCPHLLSKTRDEKMALPPPIKQNQRWENRFAPHLSSKTSDEKTALSPPIKQNQRWENRFASTYQAKPAMRKPLCPYLSMKAKPEIRKSLCTPPIKQNQRSENRFAPPPPINQNQRSENRFAPHLSSKTRDEKR